MTWSGLFLIIVVVVLFHWVCRWVSRTFRLAAYNDKAVLITGCDSGFGKALTKQLASKGFTVFAACLTDPGKKDLDGVKNVKAFKMDVTSQQSVKEGFDYVKKNLKSGQGLWGLVNNAGVLRGGIHECTPHSDFELQLNVNVLGMAFVSQVFMPLVRLSKGRIVNISSVAGRFAFPGTCAYSASKFAVQGFSDSLRREMAMWGVKVILVEPGVMKTPLWDVPFDDKKMLDNVKGIPEDVLNLYGMDFFKKSFENSKEMIAKLSNDPQLVVDLLDEALTTKYPLTRYSAGKDTYLWYFLAYAPTWVSDTLLTLDKKRPVPAALQQKSKSK
jgi:NAD(P)-dependent dehydrogenase (short-subunit alcohol dehydrogenase family)